MPVEIHVPELGESVADATVGKWRKQEGDAVKVGEALVELETDKINFEVEAEQDGVLESISKGEGETVNVGEIIGTISEADGAAPEQPEEREEEQPQAEESNGPREVEDGAGRASPSVRKLAREYEIDLAEVLGSGSVGRITREDGERCGSTPAPLPVRRPRRRPGLATGAHGAGERRYRRSPIGLPRGRRPERPGSPGGACALLQAAPDHSQEARRGATVGDRVRWP